MTVLCFIDTETTSLDPDTGEIWEVGLIRRAPGEHDQERTWQLPVNLARSDPKALEISGYFERRAVHPVQLESFAYSFMRLTLRAHVVGAVVSFDTERLGKLLRSVGGCPTWHYHEIDVEALAVGWVHGCYGTADDAEARAVRMPWNSDELSNAVGVDPRQFDRHTALGDAQWARAIYDACTR